MLQFAQDGEFYYRSGSSKLEKNDLTGAIASYRMALKLDPKNYDAVLGIAEILTAMGRTEESNRLLMVKFREEEARGGLFRHGLQLFRPEGIRPGAHELR